MKILLAEDDQNVLVITQLCLERLGFHEVLSAVDGEQAVNMAMSTAFDLILLDGIMPKKNGIDVAQELRANGLLTPIIFLSAKSEEKDIQEFLKLGTGYIPKPFDPQTISQRIEQILKAQGARSA